MLPNPDQFAYRDIDHRNTNFERLDASELHRTADLVRTSKYLFDILFTNINTVLSACDPPIIIIIDSVWILTIMFRVIHTVGA